jgi:Rrf2 family iron-sulfur cluster assembly transcriptional regulator
MFFSKSFGYALRGILYVAIAGDNGERVQLDEMAKLLGVPRFFLGKVMNRLVKDGVLNSVRGHYGGYSINDLTVYTSLLRLAELTGEMEQFDTCMLRFRKCNAERPCPLHFKMEPMRAQWRVLLAETTVEDLLKKNDVPEFLRSLSVT